MQRTTARQKARGRRRRKKKRQINQCAIGYVSVPSRATVIFQLEQSNTRIASMPETSDNFHEKRCEWPSLAVSRTKHKLSRQLIAIALISISAILNPRGAQLTESSTLTDFDGATFYKAPVGSRVRIACNASHWHDDSISLVLWFKGGTGGGGLQQHASNAQPIYTIDARQKPLSSGQARHLVADSLRGRARFVLPPTLKDNSSNQAQVPYLDLAPLDADDQGEYRCRVDYRSRPRENFLIVLFVLVPPSSLEIMDTNGRSLEQIYGPLNEGAQLTLLCLSKGGRPPPAILWKRNGHVIDDSYLTLNDFLTLKLAESGGGGAAGNGTQIAVETRDSNLSAVAGDSSSSANKLTEWPEFDYFVTGGGGGAISTAASRQQPEVASRTDRGTGRVHSQQQQEHLLIDWHADRAMTTGVNVLHLGELTRAQLTAGSEPGAGGSSTNTSGIGLARFAGLPQLECHASNMHYDLHSLIKIFAPPSLLQQQQQQQSVGASDAQTSPGPNEPPVPKALRNKTSFNLAESQLRSASSWAYAQAVERAVLANLRSSLDNELASGSSASTSTRQQEEEEVPPPLPAESARFAPNVQSPAAQHQRTATSSGPRSEELNWQQLIYQQLARPHQLAIASARSQANSVVELSAPELAQRKNASSASAAAAGQAPLARSKLIALEANLRPLDVKITSPARPLTAGQVHEFTCQSSGSRPPARLSWLKNGRPVANNDGMGGHSPRPPGNTPPIQLTTPAMSQSRLALKLERQDHGARLTCRAENANFRLDEQTPATRTAPVSPTNGTADSTPPPLDNWQLEDSISLNVHYAPQARLELGNKMLSERIRENQDMYFVCQVDSEPPVTEITWLHNERPINETLAVSRRATVASGANQHKPANHQQGQLSSPWSNLILSNNSLVLQRAQLDQAGEYACLASNSEGVGLSNRLELRVLHAPVCVSLSNDDGGGAGAQQQRQTSGSGGLELHLGAFKLATARPLKLTCQMLVPAESEDQELELSWYLGAPSDHQGRRLLARQLRRDLKLIRVETMSSAELLHAPHQPADDDHDDEETRPRVSHRADDDVGPSQGPATVQQQQRRRGKPVVVALGELTLDPATLWDDTRDHQRAHHDDSPNAGQVYCLARNSMGDQKRSCVYAIERATGPATPALQPSGSGGDDEGSSPQELENAQPDNTAANFNFACLAVNVTASSVWIGCNSNVESTTRANGTSKGALEISQVEENNDQLQRDASFAARFRFNVLVYTLERMLDMTNNDDAGQNQNHLDLSNREPKQLEANLSSHWLSEPLFAVVNLRPVTNYLLDISESQPTAAAAAGRRSLVRLKTAPPSSEAGAVGGAPASKLAIEASHTGAHTTELGATVTGPRPSIRQVTEPHPSDLVAAALISTRSTPARDNQHHQRAPASNQNNIQQVSAATGSSSLWQTLTDFVGRGRRLFKTSEDVKEPPSRGVAAGSRRVGVAKLNQPTGGSNQVTPIRWINLESADGLLALGVCIVVLLLTLIGLIALHRTWLVSATGTSRASASQEDQAQKDGNKRRRASESSSSDDADNENKKDDFLLATTRANGLQQSSPLLSAPHSDELCASESYSAQQKAAQATSGNDCAAANSPYFNQRYSTLQFQQRIVAAAQSGSGTPDTAAAKPSINFLRTSSIANGGGSLQRQQPPAYGTRASPAPAWLGLRAPSVTRSRSSQGFQQDACGDQALLLLAGGPDPARLMRRASGQPTYMTAPNDIAGGCKQRAQLNNNNIGEEQQQQQSGKCLISDANLVFANCAHPEDGASGLCNCHELALMNLDHCAQSHLDPSQLIAGCAGVHFATDVATTASPSVDSNCTTSCSLLGGGGSEHIHHYQPDDMESWQLEHHPQPGAHFVELLPPGLAGQTRRGLAVTMMPIDDDEQQQQQQLMFVGGNARQRAAGNNNGQQHHVLFSQSLNSSSSPQFSPGTNETTTTLSNQEPANFVRLAEPALAADRQQLAYASSSTKLGSGASTSNYSSDGSSSAMGGGGVTKISSMADYQQQQPDRTRQMQPSKPRLTSILKQQQHQHQRRVCKHINASNSGDNNNGNYQQRASTNQATAGSEHPEIVCQCSDNED